VAGQAAAGDLPAPGAAALQYHRGETATLLTDLGYSPVDIDFLFLTFERPGADRAFTG